MNENINGYTTEDIETLISESHDAVLLKRLLGKKLNQYSGISRDELELICAMFGIFREVEAR